jgi:hypothetical protein
MSGTTSKTAAKPKEIKSTEKATLHGKAVNAGPQRGNNSFPASNQAMANNSQYSAGAGAKANAAAKAKKP